MSKILIYTAITGDYETPRDDIRVETLELFKDPKRSSGMHKCLTPDFDEYDYSIWIDGNTSLKVTPEFLIEQLGDADILTYKHWRESLWEEAKEIIRMDLDNAQVVNAQMKRYKRQGFDPDVITANTYVIRRHCPVVENFNNMWWSELCKGSRRDQLSFDYAVWRTGAKHKYFEEEHGDIHITNTNFNYFLHNDFPRKPLST